MTIDTAQFQKLLNGFQLSLLFTNELGWDKPNLRPQSVPVNGHAFTLTPLAHKRGVAVLVCSPDAMGSVPPRATLLKIEKEATTLSYEHLLIFTDAAQTKMTWLWVARVPGQPAATRTHTWHKGTSGEALRQKLNQIVWSLEQEEAITLTDVITGLRSAFDRDRISKSFFERFKTEHLAFSEFIEGIEATTEKAWYASLMLNRLMFVYFIQQKGFLDSNSNYLSDRMQDVRNKAGKGKFHTFYRQFLRRLFHEGLGQHKKSRANDLSKLVGDVPYLNGGLFDLHELEVTNPEIDIPDEAFERLFTFFNSYDWHLDDRPLSSGTEINPDVLGYIFEKYINQKEMGAYYTKEDITEYISRSTVIPHLLDQARERCRVAFEGNSSVWTLLKVDPSRYIFHAIKTGVFDVNGNLIPASVIPEFVQACANDPTLGMLDRRFNLEEAGAYVSEANGQKQLVTLPKETWREYMGRRSRCLAISDRLANGEITCAEDLITLNLDIRQFMQDVIDTCTSPDLLRAIWQAIVGRVPNISDGNFRHGITILDPTCGSGAFLFAALNVLEPLYEACLDRMEGFVEDAKQLRKLAEQDFVEVLDEMSHHHSRSYFIYKKIILHNLFGVDIMAEAVEICKLRLFLKLVSQVDAGQDLEPLPDIDFNICAGNTLVGYANQANFDAANTLASDQTHRAEIKARTAELGDAFNFFRQQQTTHDGQVTSEDKRNLRKKLDDLSFELDRYLAQEHGIDPENIREFESWRNSHQPFHWISEFYGVMLEGGFDVVIGNPPFVEIERTSLYATLKFNTVASRNLYAMCVERSIEIMNTHAKFGMTVPLSLTFSGAMRSLREELSKSQKKIWSSHYDNIPDRLFTGDKQSDNTSKANQQRITIFIATKSGDQPNQIMSSSLMRWRSAERDFLFQSLEYSDCTPISNSQTGWAKTNSPDAVRLLNSLRSFNTKTLASICTRESEHIIVVPKTASYYIAAYPAKFDRTGQSTIHFKNEIEKDLAFILINSNIFFWHWRIFGDSFHVTLSDITSFPLIKINTKKIKECADKLRLALDECTVYKQYRGVPVPNINFNKRLDIILEIDEAILSSIGMTFSNFHPSLFLRGKSNSLVHLEIPKASHVPFWTGATGINDD